MPIAQIMAIPTEALQFAGSLVAIIALAWLVKRLGLGSAPALKSGKDAYEAARQVQDDFDAIEIARDAEGRSALLRDTDGCIMLLKAHGVHFAGRILSKAASSKLHGSRITINTGEKRFGSVTLEIEDAASWAEAINGLSKADHA